MDEERNGGRRLLWGFDRNHSAVHTSMQKQCWDVENVICCSSALIASVLLPRSPGENEGEINLIRIRKQTKHARKTSQLGRKSEWSMWQGSDQVGPARVSALNFVTGSDVARCLASLLVGLR